ncbi:FAD-dependent oxidoreductase [Mycobacterium sp. CVI_P3]|uniref:ferredoxin--NADP(+) reductase n=1 Tax=Mycobacterium pinniadriaticum TaxID=2994102 RepID=A0ABT3SA89_9MYCO|nr:FAD-dependent oxidoreductase [Mycobacterium pinniadriaticum]MCX2929935.1 FAD-dependent oxidoreductase [Mycobacterium pinniadriaticum]MCX2936416.1 FAD-dependent oxidoreductase [Mycobacterium pinniadriaticum]
MAFVITQNCCTDASCVPACPVDCIRPIPDSSGVGNQMLYIDPDACVDCGACLQVCPVGAIYYEDDLPDGQKKFRDINADFFARRPLRTRAATPVPERPSVASGALRVAVVGSGPAACYAATELLKNDGLEVNVFERLPTPFGLIRFGVAPDHQRTKEVVGVFESALGGPGAGCYFNVAVGRDISHDELMANHHAVIYAVGATASSGLGIPGEQLPGHHAAADVVAWYNGHPDHADDDLDLDTPRVVIIGNGNVALDVARVFLMAPDALANTDIADHALRQLAAGSIEEVVILARRGAADAAFSVGEFLALGELEGIDIVIEGHLGERPDDFEAALKYDIATEYRDRPATPGNKRLVFRFSTTPVEVVGSGRVEGLLVRDSSAPAGVGEHIIGTTLVLRSIGYRGTPIADLPFDASRGVVPNDGGRVVYDGQVMPGVYVTGWIKRGPRGVIGTNRGCAHETVNAVFDDFMAGRLNRHVGRNSDVDALLASRDVTVVDWQGWQAIDAAERGRATNGSRPRVKYSDAEELVAVARGR